MSKFRSTMFGIVLGVILANFLGQSEEGRLVLARSKATLQTLVEGAKDAFRI